MENPEKMQSMEKINQMKAEYQRLNTIEHKTLEGKSNSGTATTEEKQTYEKVSSRLLDIVLEVATLEKEMGLTDNFDWVYTENLLN